MNSDLSIMIVDDARLSHAIVSKTLARAGYCDIRNATNAHDAIEQLKLCPAGLVIVDWMMPNIDGIELMGFIRQLDEAINHFTFVLMLTAKDSQEAFETAFKQGVDDYINKSQISQELIPRIVAASRISDQINQLLQNNIRLLSANRVLENKAFIDPSSGLGNQKFAEHFFSESLSHIQSRGGIMCCILLHMTSLLALKQDYNDVVINELTVRLCRRIKQYIRALDHLCILDKEKLLILSLRSSMDQCELSQLKRLADRLTLKTYQTTAGFLNVELKITAVIFESKNLSKVPEFQELLRTFDTLTLKKTDCRVSMDIWPIGQDRSS